jgi:predicted metal-dependent phosphoesterase TrpH
VKRVEYHVHTERSYDSDATAQAVLDRAVAAGVHVLCVTDHDTLEGALALRERADGRVDVVIGCEITARDGSHLVGLGLREAIGRRHVLEVLYEIRRQGGWVILPHPFRRGTGVFRNELRRSPEFVVEVLSGVDAVECFNARDTWEDNRRSHDLAVAHALPAVAASDAHRADEIGRVFVEYDDDAFVHGASARRLYFPSHPPEVEHPVRRLALELYRHERALPSAVRAACRLLRARVERAPPLEAEGAPPLQEVLAAVTRGAPR